MQPVFRFYKFVNLLSLDVAAGAMICALYFTRLLGVNPGVSAFTCLGLTVWIIYTADHLLDGRKTVLIASTQRHRFHQRHFSVMAAILFIAIAADVVLIFFLRRETIQWGAGLMVVVTLYFFIQSRLCYLKEFAGALLYSAGVILPALSLSEGNIPCYIQLLMVHFVLTAMTNLVLFSWFDYPNDLQDKRSSLVTLTGREKGGLMLMVLFLIQTIVCVCLFFLVPSPLLAFAPSVMTGVLAVLFLARRYFEKDDIYRYAGDAVFYVPAIIFFL